MGYERLSARAASSLRRESRRSPEHVGSLALFEAAPFLDERGRFRLDDARSHVAGRLHRWPALRRRVQPVPFGQGRPVWVDDDRFDLTYHVRLTALPRPGREEQLNALMARLQTLPLDRRRPLWELWFVDGVEGDHVAVLQKTHLALAHDRGAAGALEAVLDDEPCAQPLDAPQWTARRAPNNAALLAHTLAERATRPAEMTGVARAALRGPRRALVAVGRRARPTVDLGSHLRYEVVRATDASESDLRAAVRSHDTSVAITFEALAAPRYLLGARLLEAFPYAPGAGSASAVAALSYDGRTGIGLTGHRAAIAELRGLIDGLGQGFGELDAAAG